MSLLVVMLVWVVGSKGCVLVLVVSMFVVGECSSNWCVLLLFCMWIGNMLVWYFCYSRLLCGVVRL